MYAKYTYSTGERCSGKYLSLTVGVLEDFLRDNGFDLDLKGWAKIYQPIGGDGIPAEETLINTEKALSVNNE